MNCEIDRNAPLTPWESLGVVALIGFALVCLVACLGGCKSYYENAGMRVRAGEITAPIEVSEPTSSTNVRFLFFLNGVDLYATKGSEVRMRYVAVKSGNWLTSATTQSVEVAVHPVLATTNLCDSARP